MPERARVLVAEDNLSILDALTKILKSAHHTVLAASTLEDALKIISNPRKRGIQVAVLDANLTKGDKSGSDGRQMVAAIKVVDPNITTIGISGEPMDYVDQYVGTEKIANLAEIVTRL